MRCSGIVICSTIVTYNEDSECWNVVSDVAWRAKNGEHENRQGGRYLCWKKERKVMNNRINTDTLVTDLKSVVRDSEELLQAVAGATGEKAESLRRRLAETMETARQTCSKLEAKTRESLETTDKVIREHPYQSMGVALAVGVVIGALVARK
jgi:ElaB/YqjD/DUF883 family membrane-anchored ribosome-binding protein